MEVVAVAVKEQARSPLGPGAVALDASEVALLQACVGFHAKSQTDPGIRDRLYQLWCKLDGLKRTV